MIADSPCKPHVVEATWLREPFAITWDLTSQMDANWDSPSSKFHFSEAFQLIDLAEYPNFAISGQIFSINEETSPEYFATNLSKLTVSFEKELRKETDNFIKIRAQEIFDDVVSLFAQLPFTKNAVEITTDSLKLSLLFPNDTLLVVSKPFDELKDVSKEDIIFSIFINSKLIASDVSEKTTLVEGFNEFVSV